MKTVSLCLICEGAKEKHGNQNEKSADLKQHTGQAGLTDAAQCRFVLPCCRYGAVNQSHMPPDERTRSTDSWGTGRWRVQNCVMLQTANLYQHFALPEA